MWKFLTNFYAKRLYNPVLRNFVLNPTFYAVNTEIVESLERLSLVDFSTDAGIERLEKSIQFADRLMEVNTDLVEPLISTVYDRNDNLRNDEPQQNCNRKELMHLAPVSEEFYYVAPLGTFSRNQSESSINQLQENSLK